MANGTRSIRKAIHYNDNKNKSNEIDRRKFMRSSAAAGAGLMLANSALGQAEGKKDINVALLGAGTQGQVLMNAIFKLGRDSGIKFRAVCDLSLIHI